MIKKFFVENFCSIKNRMDISFEASALTDETFYNNYFPFDSSNILKVVSFYGMNASGKSTIIRAFAAMRELVIPVFQNINGFANQPINMVLPYYPFEFSKQNKEKPISIGIDFSLDNNDSSYLYKYAVTYNANRVITERFEKKTSQKTSLLFDRNTNEMGLTSIEVGANAPNIPLLNSLRESVMPDRTFLSMFNSFMVPDFYDAYNFFANRLVNITPEVSRFLDIIPNKLANDEVLKNFTIKLLKAADFNIKDIDIKKSSVMNNINIPNMPGFVAEKDTLFMVHEGDLDTGSIEFVKESLGTKKIVLLAAHLYPVLSKPSVLIIDELESSLHPDLTRLIVTCFLDETINVHNSQLIFTSHETSLLDLDLLRRDQINFVYKDKKTCSTYIRTLKDFRIRKTDSVEKSYLAGRYLTSPEIKDQYLMEN